MTRSLRSTIAAVVPCLLASTVLVLPVEGAVVPADSPLRQKEFRHPGLHIANLERPAGELGPALPGRGLDLVRMGVRPDNAFFDWRGGRWASVILSQPLIPGDGKGNTLGSAKVGNAEVWKALSEYVASHQGELRVDLSELASPRIGVFGGGSLVQIHAQRVADGIPVRDSGLSAVISHGNLILLGLRNWGTLDATPKAAIGLSDAEGAVANYVSPFKVDSYVDRGHLELVPLARGENVATVPMGNGYEYRLCWVVSARISGDIGTWESLVDASTGRLIAFQDKNQYASRKILGGVYPKSNDQKPPDGLEQAAWPMPYADITAGGNTFFTDSGGAIGCAVGNVTSALSGKFMRMVDTCGAVNESSAAGDLDLGFGPTPTATDCTVPAGHSPGDTKSSRSGFYELNRIKEQARGQLPGNTWLDDQLTANMNLNQTCNAFWDGNAVNFFKSGGGCRNTGEIAAIFDHEWGHGMDNNGVNPNVTSPGESIADMHSTMRLDDSCVGRGFFINQVCGGYGDPCVGTPATGCTGVRDADWALHVSGQPHGINWILTNCGGGGGPCGREVHCEGQTTSEVGWDLQFRDLRAAPYNYDENTALELTTRMVFLGSQLVDDWYTCNPAGGGCNATGGYLQFLAADDDNGDINDGTPHMTAVRAAFERHQQHCATPVVVDSGCAGAPATAPAVNVTPMDKGAQVNWSAVAGASSYNVYRTEGVNGCSFGKVKVGEATGLSFQDQGLQNGRTYFYSVVAVGANASCMGPMSACSTVVPVDGPNLGIQGNTTITVTRGDNDTFLDNCETGTVGFTVENNGTGTLTNVRLISVTPLTHPQTVINTPLPVVLAQSLTDCATASGSFSFSPQGMNFGETTQLEFEVTADELNGTTRSMIVTIGGVESDTQFVASRTFDFETDFSGWTVQQGTYNRESPGANGTQFHLHSSTLLDDQCDVARSPEIRLKANSALSLWNRYDIEDPIPAGPYDRANVGVVDLDAGTRTTIVPNGGRLYDLPPGTPGGACVTGGEAGWAGTNQTFAISTWDSAATNPGGMFTDRRVQVEAAYGTDPGLALEGFHFDEVTITNFDELVADAQPNQCGTGINGLSITNTSVVEGNSGTTSANFTVFLSPASGQTVTVDFATADGSATVADNDYEATSGTLTFPAGTTSQPVSVTVNGDTKVEGNEGFFVNLSNPVGATIGDGQGQGTILNDDGVGGGTTFISELYHGYSEMADLAAVGGQSNNDFYAISQKPFSSYEVVVDATSGDIGPGLDLQRIAPDGSTVLQVSQSVGVGFSQSLRWANNSANEVNDETILVNSGGCQTSCGPDDVYDIRARETTYTIPRFNNAGTQITVLLLSNPTNATISGNIYFWSTAGVQVGNSPFSLAPKSMNVLNTANVAPGVGGTVTVSNDGRFGDLAGKTVALEPATGFSFDSPMLPRIRLTRIGQVAGRHPTGGTGRPSTPRLSGWGRIGVAGREIRSEDLERITRDVPLSRGLGRSYGDSSLPPPSRPLVAGSRLADRILAFDDATGILRAEAGLSLFELNRLFLPRGFFDPVAPGTQFITLGGMVAADVHGKSHHRTGSFGSHVVSLKMRVADGRILKCSRDVEPDLFRATLGGMGLTGHILEVECRLLRVPSPWILAESERIEDIDRFMDALKEAGPRWPYTVGWIDCLSRGKRMGRGILNRGRWAQPDEAPSGRPGPRSRPSVPFVLPGWVIDRWSVRAFNACFYRSHLPRVRRRVLHPESFFYPLDVVRHWNRLYGPRGFTQYQCVLPESAGRGAPRRFLELLTRRGGASMLCVIKDCGAESVGLISFPRPGTSIALDLPIRDDTQDLVNALNELVIAEGGRVYLAKDALTRADHYRAMEPRLDAFLALRREWDPQGRLRSAQSVRVLGDPP